MMGRAAGNVSWPMQVKDVHANVHRSIHAMNICLYGPHIPCTHVNIPPGAHTHLWHTSTYTLPPECVAGTNPTPRTNGELVEGDSCSIVAQGIADTYRDLVLDGGEQVHVADVAAVLEGWVLLTDHDFGAVPGEG